MIKNKIILFLLTPIFALAMPQSASGSADFAPQAQPVKYELATLTEEEIGKMRHEGLIIICQIFAKHLPKALQTEGDGNEIVVFYQRFGKIDDSNVLNVTHTDLASGNDENFQRAIEEFYNKSISASPNQNGIFELFSVGGKFYFQTRVTSTPEEGDIVIVQIMPINRFNLTFAFSEHKNTLNMLSTIGLKLGEIPKDLINDKLNKYLPEMFKIDKPPVDELPIFSINEENVLKIRFPEHMLGGRIVEGYFINQKMRYKNAPKDENGNIQLDPIRIMYFLEKNVNGTVSHRPILFNGRQKLPIEIDQNGYCKIEISLGKRPKWLL